MQWQFLAQSTGKILGISALLFGLNAPLIQAQPETPTGTAVDLTIPARVGVNYNSSGGGYDGFTTFGGFVPLLQVPGQSLTFLEGHLLLGNNSYLGSNILVGYRAYDSSSERVWGGYIGYDIRNTGQATFHQLGLGLESLGDTWDIRLNGYLPIGETRQLIDSQISADVTRVTNVAFQGHLLFLDTQRELQELRRLQAAMSGFDLETGVKVAHLDHGGDIKAYGGVYYLTAEGSADTWGGRLRLSVQPTDSFTLGIGVQHDDLFGTNVLFNVGLTFPGSRPREAGTPVESVQARLGEAVERTNSIVVDDQTETKFLQENETIVATNPETGQPWNFQHITLGGTSGKGTIEQPWATVSEGLGATRSDGNDIVYVQAGTNPGIPTGFFVPDGVQLLSTGPVQTIQAGNLGSVVLPLSGSGQFPSVSNFIPLGNNTVTMGNNTTLSGFSIDAPDLGSGPAFHYPAVIVGNKSNIKIRNNQIAAADGFALELSNVTGKAIIENNLLSSVDFENESGETDVIITNNKIGSLSVGFTNNSTQGTVQISNNQLVSLEIGASNKSQISAEIKNNRIEFLGVGVNDSAEGTFLITNNQITNSTNSTDYAGIFMGTFKGNATFIVTNNQIINPEGPGIRIRSVGNSQLAATISNNSIVNAKREGILVETEGLNIETSSPLIVNLQLLLTDNKISHTGYDGIVLNVGDDSVTDLMIANNKLNDIGGNGIAFFPSGSSQSAARIEQNTITNTGYTGIFVSAFDRAKATLAIVNNQINNPNIVLLNSIPDFDSPLDDGIRLDAENTSQLRAVIEANIINGARDSALSLGANPYFTVIPEGESASLNATVRFNTFTNTRGNNGFSAQSANQSSMCLQLLGNNNDKQFTLYQRNPSVFRLEPPARILRILITESKSLI
jgi:hypothetical protein